MEHFNPHAEQEKQQVPHLDPESHVSQDYINAVSTSLALLNVNGLESVQRALERGMVKQLPTYEERYPDSEYEDVVNDTNRENVARINCLVSDINGMLNNLEGVTVEELKAKMEEIIVIIRGWV